MKKSIKCALMSAAAVAAIAGATQASAQTAGAPDDSETKREVEDSATIVVTATKSGQSLEDTAAAISVVSADQIGAGGIENASDLSIAVPNLSVGDQFGVNRTFIRGIGLTSIDLGADGAVAFLQNGAIISRPAAQLSGFYDIEQIEVLRGPQGTTYGRGATGGVINLVTARPTSTFEGYARATYGNYDAITLEGAVGGPIAGDTLAFRVAGKYENRDGYGTNLFTGNPVDNRDAYSIRGSLLANLSPDLEVLVVADHFREDDFNYAFHYFGPTVVPEDQIASSLLGGQTINDYYAARGEPTDVRNIYSDEDAINDRKGTSVQGIVTLDKGDFTLTSTTAYRKFERFNRDDLDVSDVNAFGQNNYTEDSESFSQELTFTADLGRLSLLGGAMYFEETLFGEVRVPTVNLAQYFNIALGTNLPADAFDNGNYLQRGTVDTTAVGAYLEGSLEITPSLTFTAGARYNWEERSGVGRFTFDAQGIDIPTDKTGDWDAITPKFVLEYETLGGTLLYGKVTKGFKSGVVNIGSVNAVIDPEDVWSYEIGVRGETIDRTFGYSVAGFYYDYSNLQVGFVNANSIVETINAASARNYGIEIETTLRPGPNTTFRIFGTYLNAKYTDFCNGYYAAGDPARRQFPTCPTDPALSDLSGNKLANAPEVSVAVFADHTIELGNGATIDLSADVNFQDEVFFTEFNNQDARQEAFAIANASITYRAPGNRWSASVWGKNLFDEEVLANTIIASPLYSYVSVGSLRPPRTYGITLGYDF
ncbi:TonB-dependent receptor [Alteriqipengyuania sp. NZ-12B]|uniref:TonB-dependent receptor n=1 Tax=Alteriqipengyuania abyssalis TaxID=2860200 RepID=A0ABS7P8S5_9SPHN|nr:TonB-dependent receptor [Alteriqipengyuania abyssalis]MBY8335461.1 TonB-dependent receptor [Alteriqipengyuania abyssalis]